VKLLLVLALGALFVLPTPSAEAAKPWDIYGEEIASFEAKVVDVLCDLTGDCPADCGAGKRQLGLVMDDGTLRLLVKSNTLFAGATLDLLPYCGRRVEVDGLLIKADEMTLYFVQALREPGAEKWINTRAYSQMWIEDNQAKDSNNWWRRDPRVKVMIEEFGPVGVPGATIPTK
jgi:hypothetical protein